MGTRRLWAGFAVILAGLVTSVGATAPALAQEPVVVTPVGGDHPVLTWQGGDCETPIITATIEVPEGSDDPAVFTLFDGDNAVGEIEIAPGEAASLMFTPTLGKPYNLRVVTSHHDQTAPIGEPYKGKLYCHDVQLVVEPVCASPEEGCTFTITNPYEFAVKILPYGDDETITIKPGETVGVRVPCPGHYHRVRVFDLVVGHHKHPVKAERPDECKVDIEGDLPVCEGAELGETGVITLEFALEQGELLGNTVVVTNGDQTAELTKIGENLYEGAPGFAPTAYKVAATPGTEIIEVAITGLVCPLEPTHVEIKQCPDAEIPPGGFLVTVQLTVVEGEFDFPETIVVGAGHSRADLIHQGDGRYTGDVTFFPQFVVAEIGDAVIEARLVEGPGCEPEPSPSSSPEPPPPGGGEQPGGGLPQTGVPISMVLLFGVTTVVVGIALLFFWQYLKRRQQLVCQAQEA